MTRKDFLKFLGLGTVGALVAPVVARIKPGYRIDHEAGTVIFDKGVLPPVPNPVQTIKWDHPSNPEIERAAKELWDILARDRLKMHREGLEHALKLAAEFKGAK